MIPAHQYNFDLNYFKPLLEIICCPYTKTPLTLLTLSELEEFLPIMEQNRLPAGTIGALASNDSCNVYPIIGPIISFLEEDVLKISDCNDFSSRPEDDRVNLTKQNVKKYYDEYGWKQTETGNYYDVILYSQIGQTAEGFYELDSHLSFLDLFLGGEFFLDAASGAIPHPEYLAYSWFYKYRVCVDISLTALREAAAKLAERGFYIMSDICRLPFRDNVFDGVVSAYTVQHIPAPDQRQAITELYRVLGTNQNCCILTDLRGGYAASTVRKVGGVIEKVLRRRRKTSPPYKDRSLPNSPPVPIYSWSQNLGWWKKILSELDCEFSLKTLRIFYPEEFEYFFGDSLRAAKILRVLERSMPKFLARFSVNGLIQFTKIEPETHDGKL